MPLSCDNACYVWFYMGTSTLLCDLSEKLLLYLPSTRALLGGGGGGVGGVSGSRDMSPQKFVQNSGSLRLGNNGMIQVEAFKVDMNSLAIIFLLE